MWEKLLFKLGYSTWYHVTFSGGSIIGTMRFQVSPWITQHNIGSIKKHIEETQKLSNIIILGFYKL